MEQIQINGLIWGSLLFVLVVLSGFWLLKTGKPYRSGIFNIHKLIALGSAFLVILNLYLLAFQTTGTVLTPQWPFFLSGTLVLILFGSGAMLSIGKPNHKSVLTWHRIGAGLAATWILLHLFLVTIISDH